MSKKKQLVKIKHRNETFCFMNETRDGLVLGFPKEHPLSHLTWLFEQGRFSIHVTEEKKTGTDKYDKNDRFERNLNSVALNRLAHKIWVALEKEKGRNGLWYDIGFLYGPFHNRLFYLSYENLNGLFASLADILGIDKSHMVAGTAGAIFCLSKHDMNILIRRGENVLRQKS